jgi:PKD repeat protein
LLVNQWKHVAATADTATGLAKCYVNGQEVSLGVEFGPATFSGQLVDVSFLFIGRREDPNCCGEGDAGAAYYKGLIDEVGLYNRALSAPEIQNIFNDCTGGCSITCIASGPTQAVTGSSVSFTSGTSGNCAGPPLFDWNFGDGSAHSPVQNPSHTYTTAGTYTWMMRITIGTTECQKTGTISVAQIWQYPVLPYIAGSYANRTFYCCPGNLGRHLGEDEEWVEGTAIRAIGPGKIKFYDSASGYGELVVAIEHDLGRVYTFINAYNQSVQTRYILSIYGHLRKTEQRTGKPLKFSMNQQVDKNTIIGYVNNSSHPDGQNPDPNGDGLEHLHLGIRLSDAATAKIADGNKWLRGYEGKTNAGRDFAAASVVIPILISGQP